MESLKPPTAAEVAAVGERLGMRLSQEDLAFFLEAMEGNLAAYAQVDALVPPAPPAHPGRDRGRRPSAAENPYNAWYVRTGIRGTAAGKLAGKQVALKDSICLAGVPMMVGASTLEGYVPEVDATVVTRILEAGGEIAGKAHCEYLCFSGSSHTCAAGAVRNPRNPAHSAGGSSSGSAAVVAAGDVPMAIGGDQGGSIRVPAANCGIVGLKPTWGLVPYTGIMSLELTLDHAGPMTATVADNALLLEVLAGPDGLDPRQAGVKVEPYTKAFAAPPAGMKIAVVREGFGLPVSEPVVDALVREGAERFRALGCVVEEISIPAHLDSLAIWTPLAVEGATAHMMLGDGCGINSKGAPVLSLLDAHARWRARADELPDTVKSTLLFGQTMLQRHGGHYYAKSRALARALEAAYNAVLADYDLLLMPTLPVRAMPLPGPDTPRLEALTRSFEMIPNLAAFNVAGHPALTLPCGSSAGLPVGLQLVARHWQEATIYRAAHAYEASHDWRDVTA